MINSNAITTDASATGQQSITGKGKKGKGGSKSKTLFGSLLDMLQKGKTGKSNKAQTKQASTTQKTHATSQAHPEKVIASTTGKKPLNPTTTSVALKENLQSMKLGKNKHAHPQQNLKLEHKEKKAQNKDTHDDTSSQVIAVVQEHAVMHQPDKKIGAPQNGEQEAVITLGSHSNKRKPPTAPTQQTNIPLIDTATDGEKGVSEASQQGSPLLNHAPSNAQIAKQTTATSMPKDMPLPTPVSEQVSSSVEQKVDSNPQLATTSHLNKPSELTGTLPTGQVAKEKTAEQGIAVPPQATVVEEDNTLKDSVKASQSSVANVQRTPHQAQPSSSTHVVASHSPNAIAAATENNASSFQQDFGSQQSDIDMSMMEANKADSKIAKGVDFQAQLAYKSQRSFTPADTMLEIVRSAKTGNTSLELQLEPANLGKVQVSIQMDHAKNIQVAFTVDQAASRHALEQQMPQLRIAMAQQGLDLSGFSMQMNQHGGQQGQNEPSQRISHDEANLNATLASANDEIDTRIGVNHASNGRLSILA